MQSGVGKLGISRDRNRATKYTKTKQERNNISSEMVVAVILDQTVPFGDWSAEHIIFMGIKCAKGFFG